jgi:hypothetical protein
VNEPVGNSPRGVIPGNSHSSREELPKAEPREAVGKIVEGGVKIKKPSFVRRIARSMVAEDITEVGDFVAADVLAPAIRNLIYDIISQGAARILYGTSKARRVGLMTGVGGGPVTSLKTAYHRVSEGAPERQLSATDRARHNFDPISLTERSEAFEVLEELSTLVARYGTASVSDLYALVGVTGAFTDQNYGWRSLETAGVRPTRGGFLLDLPQPELLR